MRSARGLRRFAFLLMVPVLALAIVGCSAPMATVSGDKGDAPSVKAALFEAKRLVLAAQDQVVALIPRANTASVDRESKAQLLACGEDYLWPGGARVAIQGDLDQQAVVDSAAEKFESEWTVGASPTANSLGFSLNHDDGRKLTAVFSADGTRFTITAFSACFPFEPEAGAEY